MNGPSATTISEPEAAPFRPAKFLHPIGFTLAGIALAVSAHFAVAWQLPLPQCLWRKFVGIPCPTCGCTRSLASWAQFDLAAALRFNPLLFLLCVALLAWLIAWAVEKVSGRGFLAGVRARASRWPVWRTLLVLAAVNWIYLCFTLPR